MLSPQRNPSTLGKVLEFVNTNRAATAAAVLSILSLGGIYASNFNLDEWWRRQTHPGYQGNGKYGPTGMYYDEVERGTIPSADQSPETGGQ